MSYSLATFWYERQRFLPGVLAVAFSALLIALQCGLLLGLFSITSIPIDHTQADVWVGGPGGAERGPRPADPRELPGAAWPRQPEVERARDLPAGLRLLGQAGRRHRAVHGHRLAPGRRLARDAWTS